MLVICPECGKEVRMRFCEADSVETHGLDCGPFEHFHDEWWECPQCGCNFDLKELVA